MEKKVSSESVNRGAWCTCHVEAQRCAAATFILDDVRSWGQRGQQLLVLR